MAEKKTRQGEDKAAKAEEVKQSSESLINAVNEREGDNKNEGSQDDENKGTQNQGEVKETLQIVIEDNGEGREIRSPKFEASKLEEMLQDGRRQYPNAVLKVWDEERQEFTVEYAPEVMEGDKEKGGDESEDYPVFPKDDPSKAKEIHERRVAKYGENYVVAIKQNMQSVWSRQSWDKMDGVSGWQEAKPMPPEVVAHYRKQNGTSK